MLWCEGRTAGAVSAILVLEIRNYFLDATSTGISGKESGSHRIVAPLDQFWMAHTDLAPSSPSSTWFSAHHQTLNFNHLLPATLDWNHLLT